MTSPLTVVRNDFKKNKKSSTIYTPVGVARFLFDILHVSVETAVAHRVRFVLDKGRPCPECAPLQTATVFDPAIGSGRLTDPWFHAGSYTLGCDRDISLHSYCHGNWEGKFEDFAWPDGRRLPDLVLCNPPFNGAPAKQLYPEVFLKHIFELFGPTTPTVMFVPMGLRLNQRRKSKRFRWLRDCGAEITSIISLPLDTFPDVEFHCEILIFNVAGIKPHYWLPEEAL